MDADEFIQSIDKIYFEDEKNFNLDHLVDKLPDNLTSEYLLEYKGKLEKLLTVVTRKVSELILSHQPTYVDELQRIANLQKSITESIRVCTQGRSYLRFIKDGTAKNGSVIVEHYKRRESLAKLLDSLTAISDLRKSVFEIRTLIDSQEDFPKAIQMCKDGKALLASFQQFKCVNELGLKLNDTIELIGEQVDTVLSNMCLSFCPNVYAKLQASYVLLDRSEIAVDQLLMHFCSAINSQAHNIVINHLIQELTPNTCDEQQQQKPAKEENRAQEQMTSHIKLKKDFQELCKMLSPEKYLNCLLEVCTTFWLIMLNYKRILKWHNVGITEKSHEYLDEVNTDSDGGNNGSQQNNREEFKRLYVEQKLIGGLSRVWYDMKRKLSLLILNHDFSNYRFDEFIKILGIIDLVVRIGNEFCAAPSSEDLVGCINSQALNFFNAYHKSSMDELKMFLENELWQKVPVKNDFKLVQLKEFSFLRLSNQIQPTKSITYQISNRYNYSSDTLFFTQDIIDNCDARGNETHITKTPDSMSDLPPSVIPFEQVLQASRDTTEDLFKSDTSVPYFDREEEPLPLDKISLSTDSDDDIESELNKDFVEEDEFVSSEEEQPMNKNEIPLVPGVKQDSASIEPNSSETRYLLTKNSGPVLTNSSLNVLRLFGRYIQMMTVLEPISYEILMRIYNLMDHYTMTVYKNFGPDNDKKSDDKNISPKLKVVIRSIRESLIGGGQSVVEETSASSSDSPTKSSVSSLSVQQGVPNITSIINHDLTSGQPKSNEPIDSKKAVAVESLIFLVNQLWNLQEYLETLIPSQMRPQLREQFSQSQSIVPDFLKARSELRSSVLLNN